MTQPAGVHDKTTWHRLRLLIVGTFILLTVQGWFGDTVNLFAVPTSPVTVDHLLVGFYKQSLTWVQR